MKSFAGNTNEITNKASKPVTPFGLSKWVLASFYFVVLGVSGYPSSVVGPMKQLLCLAGVLPDLTEKARDEILTSVTSQGFSASLFGALIMGSLINIIGPKFVSILGHALSAVGFSLYFVVPNPSVTVLYVGAICMGLSFFAIFTPPLSIAALFPGNTTIVLAVLGSGPDIGLGGPILIKGIASYVGIRNCVLGYVAIHISFVIIQSLLIPNKVFEPLLEDNVMCNLDDVSGDSVVNGNYSLVSYSKLSLFQQIKTPHFVVFTLFLGLNQFRKLTYAQLLEGILNEVSALTTGSQFFTSELMLNIFSICLPFTVIPSLFMGVLTNQFGIPFGMAIQNLSAVLLFVCAVIPYMIPQLVGFLFFNIMQSYICGISCASLATYYGFATLPMLQGIQMMFAVLCTAIYPLWNCYVVERFPSITTSNYIILAVNVVAFGFPLYVYLCPPNASRGQKTIKETESLLLSGDNISIDSCQSRLHRASLAGAASLGFTNQPSGQSSQQSSRHWCIV